MNYELITLANEWASKNEDFLSKHSDRLIDEIERRADVVRKNLPEIKKDKPNFAYKQITVSLSNIAAITSRLFEKSGLSAMEKAGMPDPEESLTTEDRILTAYSIFNQNTDQSPHLHFIYDPRSDNRWCVIVRCSSNDLFSQKHFGRTQSEATANLLRLLREKLVDKKNELQLRIDQINSL